MYPLHKGNKMQTVAITDYKVVSKKLARVILSTTGNPSKSTIEDAVAKKSTGTFAVVKGSFRKVAEGVAVGFVKANTQVRAFDKTKYRTFASASNIMMDKSDESLWEVKTNSTGKFLVRKNNEDLSALLEASTMRRSDVVRLARLTIAKAEPSDAVVFVDDEGEVQAGYAVSTNDEEVKVLEANTRKLKTVGYGAVVGIMNVPVEASLHRKVKASAATDKMVDYYTQLFSYAPDYLEKVINNINETAIA